MPRKPSFSSPCKDHYLRDACLRTNKFCHSFFTLTGIGLELWSYWQKNRDNATPLHEKRRDPESAGGPPLDAPAA